MKRKLILVFALASFLVGGLSACCHKQTCPSCPTALGQGQYVPQQAQSTSSFAEESAPVSRRSSIK